MVESFAGSGFWNLVVPCSFLHQCATSLCHRHTCLRCGDAADEYGLHGLSCKRSAGRYSRHEALNALIAEGLSQAGVPLQREPQGLQLQDGRRPDGITVVPYAQGRPILWDVTVVGTCCASYLPQTSVTSGAAASRAEGLKTRKYHSFAEEYDVVPLAFESHGALGPETDTFLMDLRTRLRTVTGRPAAGAQLLQRLSIALQRGNAICVQGSYMDSLVAPSGRLGAF